MKRFKIKCVDKGVNRNINFDLVHARSIHLAFWFFKKMFKDTRNL